MCPDVLELILLPPKALAACTSPVTGTRDDCRLHIAAACRIFEFPVLEVHLGEGTTLRALEARLQDEGLDS